MSSIDDSQNNFGEPHVESDSFTSPERTPSDPGTPNSHGMPKAATKSRKKLNSDEDDYDFVPVEFALQKQKEKSAVRKVVRKEYAKPYGNRKPGVKRLRKRIVHVIGRQTSILATTREAAKAARNALAQPPELKTREEEMSFLVSTIQGMEKNISEILLNQKSLERIVETKFHDLDVKVTELTTTVKQLQHEVDRVKIPHSSDDDDDDDDDLPLRTTARFMTQTNVNDDAYMSTMGVGSNNSHWSQTNDMHLEDHEFELDEDDEGIVGAPKGRGGNYTNKEDVVLCKTWLDVSRDPSVGGDHSRVAYWLWMKEHFDLCNVSGIDHSWWSTINKDCQQWAAAQKVVDKLNPSGTNDNDRLNIAQNLFKGEEKRTKKGKIKKGSPFTLPHCYKVLKDDEKWKKREDIDDLDSSKKRKRTIDLVDDEEEDASSEECKRSPTPNSVSYSKPK
ncbi:putative receptor protein kinase ZmPK1 [Hordeum vulgare]|nr:putative receptor protein kinase ZmPK1 [Hordeum vulgare]